MKIEIIIPFSQVGDPERNVGVEMTMSILEVLERFGCHEQASLLVQYLNTELLKGSGFGQTKCVKGRRRRKHA